MRALLTTFNRSYFEYVFSINYLQMSYAVSINNLQLDLGTLSTTYSWSYALSINNLQLELCALGNFVMPNALGYALCVTYSCWTWTLSVKTYSWSYALSINNLQLELCTLY